MAFIKNRLNMYIFQQPWSLKSHTATYNFNTFMWLISYRDYAWKPFQHLKICFLTSSAANRSILVFICTEESFLLCTACVYLSLNWRKRARLRICHWDKRFWSWLKTSRRVCMSTVRVCVVWGVEKLEFSSNEPSGNKNMTYYFRCETTSHMEPHQT